MSKNTGVTVKFERLRGEIETLGREQAIQEIRDIANLLETDEKTIAEFQQWADARASAIIHRQASKISTLELCVGQHKTATAVERKRGGKLAERVVDLEARNAVLEKQATLARDLLKRAIGQELSSPLTADIGKFLETEERL